MQPWAGIFNWDAGFPQDRFEPPSMDPSWGNRNRPGAIDPEYGRTPYIQSWNFNIQRELPGGLVLDLGYVGNKATGIYTDQTALWNQLAGFGAGAIRPQSEQPDPQRGRCRRQRRALSVSWIHRHGGGRAAALSAGAGRPDGAGRPARRWAFPTSTRSKSR